jgi:hypothetical protein
MAASTHAPAGRGHDSRRRAPPAAPPPPAGISCPPAATTDEQRDKVRQVVVGVVGGRLYGLHRLLGQRTKEIHVNYGLHLHLRQGLHWFCLLASVRLFGVAAVENGSQTQIPMFPKSESEAKSRKNRHFGRVRLSVFFFSFGFGLIVPTPNRRLICYS